MLQVQWPPWYSTTLETSRKSVHGIAQYKSLDLTLLWQHAHIFNKQKTAWHGKSDDLIIFDKFLFFPWETPWVFGYRLSKRVSSAGSMRGNCSSRTNTFQLVGKSKTQALAWRQPNVRSEVSIAVWKPMYNIFRVLKVMLKCMLQISHGPMTTAWGPELLAGG